MVVEERNVLDFGWDLDVYDEEIDLPFVTPSDADAPSGERDIITTNDAKMCCRHVRFVFQISIISFTILGGTIIFFPGGWRNRRLKTKKQRKRSRTKVGKKTSAESNTASPRWTRSIVSLHKPRKMNILTRGEATLSGGKSIQVAVRGIIQEGHSASSPDEGANVFPEHEDPKPNVGTM